MLQVSGSTLQKVEKLTFLGVTSVSGRSETRRSIHGVVLSWHRIAWSRNESFQTLSESSRCGDNARNYELRKALNTEPLLRVDTSSCPECHGKDGWIYSPAYCTEKRPMVDQGPGGGDYISDLAWFRVSVNPAELSNIAVNCEVFRVLGLLTMWPSSEERWLWKVSESVQLLSMGHTHPTPQAKDCALFFSVQVVLYLVL